MAPAEVEPFTADFATHPQLVKGYIGPGVLGEKSASGIRYLLDPRVVPGTAWITGAERARPARLRPGRRPRLHRRRLDRGGRGPRRRPLPDLRRARSRPPAASRSATSSSSAASTPRRSACRCSTRTASSSPSRWAPTASASAGRSPPSSRRRTTSSGLCWPREVAPADVHVVATGKDAGRVRRRPSAIAAELEAAGVRVLYDDRPKVSPGVKFKDAELLGMPDHRRRRAQPGRAARSRSATGAAASARRSRRRGVAVASARTADGGPRAAPSRRSSSTGAAPSRPGTPSTSPRSGARYARALHPGRRRGRAARRRASWRPRSGPGAGPAATAAARAWPRSSPRPASASTTPATRPRRRRTRSSGSRTPSPTRTCVPVFGGLRERGDPGRRAVEHDLDRASYHERVFARDGVLDLIDGAVYTSEIEHAKPHPEAFRAAVAAVGVDDPAACVYVGDRRLRGRPRRPARRAARRAGAALGHPGRPAGAGRRHAGRRRPAPARRSSTSSTAGTPRRVTWLDLPGDVMALDRRAARRRGSRRAGWVDAVVGGGGLIQLPALLLGLPAAAPAQILATNKLSERLRDGDRRRSRTPGGCAPTCGTAAADGRDRPARRGRWRGLRDACCPPRCSGRSCSCCWSRSAVYTLAPARPRPGHTRRTPTAAGTARVAVRRRRRASASTTASSAPAPGSFLVFALVGAARLRLPRGERDREDHEPRDEPRRPARVRAARGAAVAARAC